MFRSARLAKSFIVSCIVLAATAFGQAPSGEPTYIQLILDASGSMFNKLKDGRYRIVAAKDVLTQLISSLPEDQGLNVGLRVYGAERWASDPDACEDTHLMVPMEGLDRSLLLQTVRDTQAQGATPIALSLELAAEDFPSEGRKVIVLITDGIESCRTDLRDVAERLRSQGIDVDLRIIGIDLDDFARQAFEGLGTFENATSATELLDALNRAVEVAPAEVTYPVTVTLTRDGAPASEGATVEFIGAVDEAATVFSGTGTPGEFRAELTAGAYTARVRDAFSGEPLLVSGLTVADQENAYTFELAPQVEVAVTLSDETPDAGSTLTVTFEGAPEGPGEVWLAPEGADDVWIDYERAQGPSGSVDIRVPDQVGTFEARYVISLPEGGYKAVGRASFEVQPVTATVTAPSEAVGGSDIDVGWEGPGNEGDYLTIVPAGSPQGAYEDYEYTRAGSPVSLRVPEQAGDYEVRYVTARSNQTLASVGLVVTAATATVSAPKEAVAGSEVEVTWQGPDNSGDYLTIVPAGSPAGTYDNYEYTNSGSPTGVRAPGQPGDYEVRYVTGGDGATLASAPLTVVAATASLTAAQTAVAGADVEIEWTGPNNAGDYLTIVPAGSPAGTYLDYEYTNSGNPASVRAPEEPGQYEVRYVAGVDDATLASSPLTVEAATASVDGPQSAAPGAEIVVAWTGPDNRGDYVTIVPAGSPQGAYEDYEYTSNGNPVTLRVSDQPGDYEIRYVTGGSDYTLASQPLTVR